MIAIEHQLRTFTLNTARYKNYACALDFSPQTSIESRKLPAFEQAQLRYYVNRCNILVKGKHVYTYSKYLHGRHDNDNNGRS